MIFWDRVIILGKDECWLWQGHVGQNGYGQVGYKGKVIGAHRMAYALHYGEEAGDLFVCHTCDQRDCVNPHHLFLGTVKDNAMDAARKGRVHRPTGEGNYNTKLNPESVRTIRRQLNEGISQRKVAQMHGVSRGAIGSIIRGESWSYVGGEWE